MQASKLLEENTGENSSRLCLGKYFLNTTPKAGFMKEKTNKLNVIKKFQISMKRQARDWETMFAKHVLDKELVCRIIIRKRTKSKNGQKI